MCLRVVACSVWILGSEFWGAGFAVLPSRGLGFGVFGIAFFYQERSYVFCSLRVGVARRRIRIRSCAAGPFAKRGGRWPSRVRMRVFMRFMFL